ncbi:MAG: hypothetical protein CMM58_06625 [Rhodospirillaceae bacterium]|nr:hypothetical protein [Rhodospirillaceae bacterium]|tara:strand:- start:124 stop:810 length:687 start_codon:yes stop_codon:yes gene_type:complete
MLLGAIKTLAQLGDPGFRRVLLYSVSLSVISLIACVGLSWGLLNKIGVFGIGFIDTLVPWIGSAVIFSVGLVFFPSTIMLISSLFAGRILACVERKYFPNETRYIEVGLFDAVKGSIALVLISGILNICLLPVYALGMLIPGLSFVVFYCANGYLIGRELFETVAGLHLPANQSKELRKKNFVRITWGGVIVTFFATIPIANLLTPIIGLGMMVHLFHRLREADRETD